MKTSKAVLDLIKTYIKVRDKTYRQTAKSKITIGYGHEVKPKAISIIPLDLGDVKAAYLGKSYNAHIKFSNYGYCDYAPWQGRFITVDPIKDGFNWYAYWENKWEHLITIFDYPDSIRKVIYTTNAIESLNSVIRKVIKNKRIFPHGNRIKD